MTVGGGASNMGVAESSSLLVSPFSRGDVEKEFDILDMVDENEQYEVIRSFAARPILPYMRGPKSEQCFSHCMSTCCIYWSSSSNCNAQVTVSEIVYLFLPHLVDNCLSFLEDLGTY